MFPARCRVEVNVSETVDPTFDAVLLAGGRSQRMGTDKACLTLPDGRFLWQRQRALLEDAGAGTVFISARADQAWADAEPCRVEDLLPDAGPLGGIVAAFEQSRATHLHVLAVDLPKLPVSWLRQLGQCCRIGAGACGRHADDTFEPLAAVFPVSWLPEWRQALLAIDGERSVQRLLTRAEQRGELFVRPIEAREAEWFRNVNRPDDLRCL